MQKIVICLALALCLLPADAQQTQIKNAALILDGAPLAGKEVNLIWTEAANYRSTRALKNSKIPLTAFVNENRIINPEEKQRRLLILGTWLAAGAKLGNGTFSGFGLSETESAEWFKKDIIYGQANLKEVIKSYGDTLRYFLFPKGDLGGSKKDLEFINRTLDSLGLEPVTLTMEFEDELFNTPYINSKIEQDSMLIRYIGDRYVEHFLNRVDYYEKLSEENFGRQISHVICLRASEINYDMLDYLIYILWMRGYRFMSLGDVLGDEVYKLIPNQRRGGILWNEAKKLNVPPPPKPGNLIDALYRRQTY